jgi:hypothetical protein
MPRVQAGVVIGYVLALLWFSATVCFAMMSGEPMILVLDALFGAALGWALGLLVWPNPQASGTTSRAAAGVVVALAAGYALAKLGDILGQLRADGVPITIAVLIFATDFLVGFLCIAIWRLQSSRVAT